MPLLIAPVVDAECIFCNDKAQNVRCRQPALDMVFIQFLFRILDADPLFPTMELYLSNKYET